MNAEHLTIAQLARDLWALVVANQVGILCVLAWAILDKVLPRIAWLRANTTAELVANMLKAFLINRVPLVGKVVTALASPPAPAPAVAVEEKPKFSPPPAAAMLPLLFAAAALVSGCAAWKACELGKLPQAEQTALAIAATAAMDPSSTVESLERAAFQLAPGQLECALVALADLWSKHDAGAVSEAVRHAQQVTQAYLARHHASVCAPRAVALLDDFEVGVCDSRAVAGADACRPIVLEV